MDIDNKGALSRFTKVKRDLDPAFGYVVFEKPGGSKDEESFSEITKVLAHVKKKILGREVHFDEDKKRLLLVVKLDLEQGENIIQEFLGVRLPEEITFYVYGSRSKSQ